jgi:signal transduction histidine kinase
LRAQGLRRSLTDLAATLEGRDIAVTVDVADVEPLDEATEALVYRAAQEGVRNVVRHADATAVVLSVARRGLDELVLTVRDNGRGLADPDTARRRGSVGLDLLGQLVAAHGGRLSVGDVEDGGTQLVVVLPAGPRPVPEPAESPSPVAVGDR